MTPARRSSEPSGRVSPLYWTAGPQSQVASRRPGRSAPDLAPVRAEATAEVLAVHQASAKAAEAAARSSPTPATERAGWERDRTPLRDQIEEPRPTAAAGRERAASAEEALNTACSWSKSGELVSPSD